MINEDVDQVMKNICLEIEKRYQINFLVQSVPTYSVTKIVTTVKSITARGVFRECPEVKKELWGGEFWTDGYFASTVSKHGDENMISNYVKNQGKKYNKLYADHQLVLF